MLLLQLLLLPPIALRLPCCCFCCEGFEELAQRGISLSSSDSSLDVAGREAAERDEEEEDEEETEERSRPLFVLRDPSSSLLVPAPAPVFFAAAFAPPWPFALESVATALSRAAARVSSLSSTRERVEEQAGQDEIDEEEEDEEEKDDEEEEKPRRR